MKNLKKSLTNVLNVPRLKLNKLLEILCHAFKSYSIGSIIYFSRFYMGETSSFDYKIQWIYHPRRGLPWDFKMMKLVFGREAPLPGLCPGPTGGLSGPLDPRPNLLLFSFDLLLKNNLTTLRYILILFHSC